MLENEMVKYQKYTNVYNNQFKLRSRAINNCYSLCLRAINKHKLTNFGQIALERPAKQHNSGVVAKISQKMFKNKSSKNSRAKI